MKKTIQQPGFLISEEWKDIPEFEGVYQISNHGRIRSLPRRSFNHILKGKILKGGIDTNGYHIFRLHARGYSKTFKAHRLVAIMFICNPNNKIEVNHLDGNKINNHINNLEWATRKENQSHAVANGLVNMPTGELNKSSKLILDMGTGIFYFGVKSAAIAKGYKYSYLAGMLNGGFRNYSSLMYV